MQRVLHPQDAGFVADDLPKKFQSGSPFEYEVRLKRKDGQYRWFHYRLSPMSDEQGRITRWYAAATDIEELKLAEQRLQEENVALREEITRSSMFEEIVGSSAPLRKVLSDVARVAPTDSTVLISIVETFAKDIPMKANRLGVILAQQSVVRVDITDLLFGSASDRVAPYQESDQQNHNHDKPPLYLRRLPVALAVDAFSHLTFFSCDRPLNAGSLRKVRSGP